MHKVLVVLKREYAQVVKKKSFLIGLFLTPALMGAFMVVPTLLARMNASSTEHLAVVDQSGYNIGRQFAASLQQFRLNDSTAYYNVDRVFALAPADSVRANMLVDSLRQLVSDKDLKYFLVVRPGAHLTDSNLYLVTNSDNFRSIDRFERNLSDILSTIRLKQSDVNLTIDSVLALTKSVSLPIRDTKGESIPFEMKYVSAMVFVMLMFAMLIGYGQMVMRSVIEEKSSRIMEVLVSSVTPFQLMIGKIIGLGAATFTQIGIWLVIGLGLYTMKGALNVDPSIDRIVFNPLIACSFVAFLITGYLLFSSLFALVGSVVTSEKEAQNLVAPITITMILPLVLGISVVQDPHSSLATVLSFIPFTAPTMMIMRVVFLAPTLTEYSLFSGIVGEAILSFLIVCLSVVAMIWLTGKIFRIGILMYGKRATLPEIVKWLRY